MKESFVFYKSFYEALHKLQDKELKADLFEAICELALYDNDIELTNAVGTIIMDLIRPQIVANNKRYINGKKGGAPIGNQNAKKEPMVDKENKTKTTKKQPKNNQKQPNVNVNENVNVNVNDNNKRNIKEKKTTYGDFNNVLLSDDEYHKLEESNLLTYINRLSSYIASSGKRYKSHYATILNWSRKDNEHRTVKDVPEWFNKDLKTKDEEMTEEEKKIYEYITGSN